MRITTDGIVVRQKNFGEKDRLLTILTRDHGMITAFANGARGPRSPLAASTELLTYSNFVLFEYKGRTTVDAASAEQVFFGLRQDVELLALGSYLAQLCTEVLPEGEQEPQCLRLLLNSLYLLDAQKRTPDFIKPVFELRLLALSGFMPDLVACGGCGCFEGAQMHFLPCRASCAVPTVWPGPRRRGRCPLPPVCWPQCATSSTATLKSFLLSACRPGGFPSSAPFPSVSFWPSWSAIFRPCASTIRSSCRRPEVGCVSDW